MPPKAPTDSHLDRARLFIDIVAYLKLSLISRPGKTANEQVHNRNSAPRKRREN